MIWQPIETAPRDGTIIELRNELMEKPVRGRWGDLHTQWSDKLKLTWVSEYTPDEFFPFPAGKLNST